MAGSKTKLFRPHETGRRRLARHYGDWLGKHLLSAVGRRLTSCMGLAEVACHPTSQKHQYHGPVAVTRQILTACPSSSVSASSGVEDEGESEP